MSTLTNDYRIGLGPNDPYPGDKEGTVTLSEAHARFLRLLQKPEWKQHPDYRDVRIRDYLVMVMRDIYFVSDDVIEMVEDDLLSRKRLCKPHREYIKALCRAAMEIQQLLTSLSPGTAPRGRGRYKFGPAGLTELGQPEPPPNRSRRVRLND